MIGVDLLFPEELCVIALAQSAGVGATGVDQQSAPVYARVVCEGGGRDGARVVQLQVVQQLRHDLRRWEYESWLIRTTLGVLLAGI